MRIRFRKLDLIFILVLVVAAGMFLVYRQDRQEKMPSFEPSDYGIPDEIAGYQVLAVQTADSNPCQPENQITVVLMYANANAGTGAVYATLNEIDPDIGWQLELVSGGTREQVVANMKRITEWLSLAEECARFSEQPLPTNTPQVEY